MNWQHAILMEQQWELSFYKHQFQAEFSFAKVNFAVRVLVDSIRASAHYTRSDFVVPPVGYRDYVVQNKLSEPNIRYLLHWIAANIHYTKVCDFEYVNTRYALLRELTLDEQDQAIQILKKWYPIEHNYE